MLVRICLRWMLIASVINDKIVDCFYFRNFEGDSVSSITVRLLLHDWKAYVLFSSMYTASISWLFGFLSTKFQDEYSFLLVSCNFSLLEWAYFFTPYFLFIYDGDKQTEGVFKFKKNVSPCVHVHPAILCSLYVYIIHLLISETFNVYLRLYEVCFVGEVCQFFLTMA